MGGRSGSVFQQLGRESHLVADFSLEACCQNQKGSGGPGPSCFSSVLLVFCIIGSLAGDPA